MGLVPKYLYYLLAGDAREVSIVFLIWDKYE